MPVPCSRVIENPLWILGLVDGSKGVTSPAGDTGDFNLKLWDMQGHVMASPDMFLALICDWTFALRYLYVLSWPLPQVFGCVPASSANICYFC